MASKIANQRLDELNPDEDFTKYHDDPVGFCEDILGFEPWDDPKGDSQKKVLVAVVDNERITIVSGHKVGKSTLLAAIALWAATVRNARCFLVAPTFRQVEQVLWREVKRLFFSAKTKLPATIHETSQSGLTTVTGGQILGVTARDNESFSGLSGANVFYLVDEASGVKEEIHTAIRANAAGGATIIYTGNPTRRGGEFYLSHTSKRDGWKCFHISSKRVAELSLGIPGIATIRWVEECAREWGDSSPKFFVRVLGLFPEQGDASIVSYAAIQSAINLLQPPAFGSSWDSLVIGVDVARFGDDATVFCARRGNYVFPLSVHRNLGSVEIVGELRRFVDSIGFPGEQADPRFGKPRVLVDEIGVGAGVADMLAKESWCEASGVNVARKAIDESAYTNLRTQLIDGVNTFLKEGGSLPSDEALASELLALEYSFDSRGRMKADSKDEAKKVLGRSPDRADALALCVMGETKRRGVQPVVVGQI